ncbi:hypothetical protein V6N11_065141 [Hibiscus sabdariffa]|uniref:Uncharacterized protein n=1 Tax=Hibiscus sabdariffa TaxID=183260 RepID=A0ABR2SJ02_9ROSI
MTIGNKSHIDSTHSRARIDFKRWEDQMNNIENQLSILESIFEENPRYLLKIQNLLLKNGIILKSGDCGTLLQLVEEAQEHVELTFHSNSSKPTEVVHHFSGNASLGAAVNCRVGNEFDPAKDESYDYDAPIDEYGLWSEPKWGHLKDLNAAIKLCERALVAVDSPQYMKLGPNQEAHVYWENAYSTGLNTSLLKVKARVLHFLQILMSIIQQQ